MPAYPNKYEGGEQVLPGDILMHKNWMDESRRPLNLEVTKPCAFGSACPGKITVVLLSESKQGFSNRSTETLPRENGGMAFVSPRNVKFVCRGHPQRSVYTPLPKKEEKPRRREY